ncbi:MAG TPA: hypothetical protein VJT72_12190 [Pseudonocardiaceae bacterium]|nr:hypothetical protein [Pseudonocardiaceae bacterium]
MATATAVTAPDRVRGLIRVDGNLPGDAIFPTADASADHHLEATVRADAHDLFTNTGASEAVERTNCPVILLRAPRGMLDDPPNIYPPDAVGTVAARATSIEAEDVPTATTTRSCLATNPPQ